MCFPAEHSSWTWKKTNFLGDKPMVHLKLGLAQNKLYTLELHSLCHKSWQ